jgi:FkbM family methyltransferase
MKSKIVQIVKQMFPEMWNRYSQLRYQQDQLRYRQQENVTIVIGEFEMSLPDRHLLVGIVASQPFRDGGLGLAAKYLSKKYPNKTMIDIGANIGDTAAIMATNATNPLVLVEPSDYFFTFLEQNSVQFPNQTTLINGFVNDGTAVRGSLYHWLGTAQVTSESDTVLTERSFRLSELTVDDICLIKTDTDGYDYRILMAGLEYVVAQKCGVFIEVQIKNEDETVEAFDLFTKLFERGFCRFVVWDDAGWLLLTTNDLNTILDLIRYLDSLAKYPTRKSI